MPYSSYCIKECPIGREESSIILLDCDSAFDAAFDMQLFVKDCKCPYEKEKEEYDEEDMSRLIREMYEEEPDLLEDEEDW